MSVLACDRKGCQNIMCNRYSPAYGYICDDCFEELVGLGINILVIDFMGSEKTETKQHLVNARAYYSSIFNKEV